MMTAVKTKPRAKTGRRGKTKKQTEQPTPTLRARLFYDHKTRTVVLSDPETKVEIDRRTEVEVKNVKVVIEGGHRDGCLNTGFLGYLVGDVSMAVGKDGGHMLRWCGQDFQAIKLDFQGGVSVAGDKRLASGDAIQRVVVRNGAMTADI